MANFFDRFEASPSTPAKTEGNFFDRFDAVSAEQPAPPQQRLLPKFTMPEYDANGMPIGTTQEVEGSDYTGQNPVDSLSRGIIQGATLGSGDEIWAAGAGAIAKLRGEDFGPAYDSALASSQANNKAASDAHPWLYTGGQVAGSVPGLVYGGSTAVGGRALGLTGSLATRTGASLASGAGIGGVQGFAGTDGSIDERIAGARSGGMFGGVVGGITPGAASVIGAGTRGAVSWLGQRGVSIPGLPNSGMKMLADDLENSGGAQAVQSRLAELGPDAMLLDASPSFQGRAQGLAVRPETRQTIIDPLTARNEGTNQRLRQGINDAFGPAPIPSRLEAGLRDGRSALSPEYERVLQNANAVDSQPIADAIESRIPNVRGEARTALMRVRQDLNISDVNGNTGVLDAHPRALLETRKAIDGARQNTQDRYVQTVLGDVRRMIDNELSLKVPGIKDVDARFAELSRQSQGLERGAEILGNGRNAIRPTELGDELSAGVIPQGQFVGPSATAYRMRQGARSEIDRAVGTQANDLQALRSTFRGEGDWNQQKLAQMFGDQPTSDAFRLLDREATFRNTFGRIDQNSQTAQRSVAERGVAPRGEGPTPSDAGTIIAGGVGGPKAIALAAMLKAGRYGIQRAQNAADIERNRVMADLLTQGEGAARDVTISRLADYLMKGEKARNVSEMTRRIAQALLQSQGNQASEALGGPQLLLAR